MNNCVSSITARTLLDGMHSQKIGLCHVCSNEPPYGTNSRCEKALLCVALLAMGIANYPFFRTVGSIWR